MLNGLMLDVWGERGDLPGGDGRLNLCTLITQREQVCSLTQSPISPGQVRLVKPNPPHTHSHNDKWKNGRTKAFCYTLLNENTTDG